MRDKKPVIIGLLLALVIILACIFGIMMLNKNETPVGTVDTTDFSEVELSLISPSGAPALSLAGVIDDSSIALDYEIVDGSEVLSAEFLDGSSDLIIAPVNLGTNLINNGAEYQLLAVVSWGNLYIVGDRSTYDGRLAAFGEGAVPGRVFELIRSELNEEVTVDYYNSVAEVAPLLLSGEYGAALLAEPVATRVRNSNKALEVLYDVQDLYEDVTGDSTYPQAAIFVSSQAIKDKTEAILNLTNSIQDTIIAIKNDTSLLDSYDVDYAELGFDDIALLKDAYSGMALDLVYGTDCVDEVKGFLELFDIAYDDTMYVR